MAKEAENDITIVIPVYNRAGIVERTLQSVACQTWRPLSVILVDNNSSDGSMKVLQEWKKATEATDFRVAILEEPTPGACAARNAGLAAVDTRWTLFFDSDDVMAPEHVEMTMRFIAAHPEAEVVGWQRLIHLLGGGTVTRRFSDSDHVFENIFHSIFSTQNYCARTSTFRRAGGWMASGGMGDDVELGQRILNLAPRIFYRHGPTTVEVYEQAASLTHGLEHRMQSYMATMEALRANLPAKYHHWLDLRELLQAAGWGRDDEMSREVVGAIMRRTPWPRRWLWRAAYGYQRLGGRGVARIYKLIGRP